MPLLSAACVQVPASSQLALGLGAAVSRGRGVPELCPHLGNFHVEAHARMAWCQVQALLGHAPEYEYDISLTL